MGGGRDPHLTATPSSLPSPPRGPSGGGSATLSMAYAGAQFTGSLLEAMAGKKGAGGALLQRTHCTEVISVEVPRASAVVWQIKGERREGRGAFMQWVTPITAFCTPLSHYAMPRVVGEDQDRQGFAPGIPRAPPPAVVECCYTENSLTDASFFSLPTTLGPNGAEEPLCYLKYHNAASLSAFEKANYTQDLPPPPHPSFALPFSGVSTSVEG